MADEWATADTFDAIKLNRKTRFVGTGAQATAFITSPQIGQQVYCTASDSTFLIDKISTYNSASTWITPNIDETSEYTVTLGDSGSGVSIGTRYFQYITIPSTEKFYIFTALECFPSNSGTPTTFLMGVDLVDASPPVQANTPLLALCTQVSRTSVQGGLVNTIFSRPVRAGTVVGVWCQDTLATASGLQHITTPLSSVNRTKAASITYNLADNTSWGTGTDAIYMKAYYRGYN